MNKFTHLSLITLTCGMMAACTEPPIFEQGRGFAPYTMERTAGYAPGYVLEKMMPAKDMVVETPADMVEQVPEDITQPSAMGLQNGQPMMKDAEPLFKKALTK